MRYTNSQTTQNTDRDKETNCTMLLMVMASLGCDAESIQQPECPAGRAAPGRPVGSGHPAAQEAIGRTAGAKARRSATGKDEHVARSLMAQHETRFFSPAWPGDHRARASTAQMTKLCLGRCLSRAGGTAQPAKHRKAWERSGLPHPQL